ncbi:translation initiation factor IF-2 N-terminal domain-containing protein [Prochlorococcus sp. MIT 1223]|uniref:translation initiation factor IF-2 N-terminal domain-containing protein n=1 Tax=Prochlorococcus sp. MIT 1223 TaxID=3096217 RepID=UPI002A75928C|nr:translation initiation factor IF-2 N-terminal domain-containing protein [Prochlorococcus sp. MIT 1223]
MKIRVKELSEALGVEIADIISICAILKLPASSSISSLSLQDAKKITDYHENN